MSKANALAGLIGTYGDSGDESDDGVTRRPASEAVSFQHAASAQGISTGASATIHPAPIPHCPWSACYDETSGFTYYWNQQTNAVTWEAPPEYLLALKLAQQQLHTSGSAEVSAEEWQLYQQALAEKQNTKVIAKPPAVKKESKPIKVVDRNSRFNKKRCYSDDEDEKIELITSYHNSDSESDHEAEAPVKKRSHTPPLPPRLTPPLTSTKTPKNPHKKAKTKPVEYGPTLPPNQNYTVPIGPEIPPELLNNSPKPDENKAENGEKDESKAKNTEDAQDENTLLKRLKDKAKLLEKLGGELPSGLEKIIREETQSGTASPTRSDDKISIDIDDLLEEIEKKELPKAKTKKIDMFNEDSKGSVDSARHSPKSGINTPEPKSLFPSSKNIDEETPSLFPNAAQIEEILPESKPNTPLPPESKLDQPLAAEKKGTNLYLPDPSEPIEKSRKKLRISNSVLPERKKAELPSYTTKYSQHIEGFSSERTGLGFSKEEDGAESPKKTINYGKGLMFTKGEVLNEDKKDEDLEELTDLVEAKLRYLNQLQPGAVAPVQEMLIQMQTLVSAFRAGALAAAYWLAWARRAAASLAAHERAAAPPGWTALFQRSEERYKYVRDADGFEQWEYPAVGDTDMDISTTPPHPGIEAKPDIPPPPLPRTPPPPPPPPAINSRVATPPPPAWADPPPPGCDDAPPPPLPPPPPSEPKQEIGDELMSFYNDIAELEKVASGPPTAPSSPEPPLPPEPKKHERPRDWEREPKKHERERDSERESKKRERERDREKEKEKEKDKDKHSKKKSKVKISTSMGMKHKTVSSMVAKWQQVADEIQSD